METLGGEGVVGEWLECGEGRRQMGVMPSVFS